jgi:hypothetical protein
LKAADEEQDPDPKSVIGICGLSFWLITYFLKVHLHLRVKSQKEVLKTVEIKIFFTFLLDDGIRI